MLYIQSYFKMNILNIIVIVSFWLIIYFQVLQSFVNNCVIQPLAAMQCFNKLSICQALSHLYSYAWLSGSLKPPPTSLRIYLMYFASHLANTVSYETVKLYLVAVQDLHLELNFPLKLIEMHRLQKILTGIKRLTPTKRLGRFSITLTVLHSIHSYLKPKLSHNLNHIMLWVAFTLAFIRFLRSSEFTCNESEIWKVWEKDISFYRHKNF